MKKFLTLLLGVWVGFLYADQARDYYNKLDGETELHLFSLRSDMQPRKGFVYCHSSMGALKVDQTVGEYCIVSNERSDANLMAVVTAAEYADGSFLGKGYYEYTGLTEFTGVTGAPRKIHTFKEIPSSISKGIEMIVAAEAELAEERARSAKLSNEVRMAKEKLDEQVEAEKLRIRNERLKLENEREIARMRVEQKKEMEELRVKNERLKLENEREISRMKVVQKKELDAIAEKKRQEMKELRPKLQTEREAYAKSKLEAIDFNVRHHYVVQRSVKKMLKDVEVVDPLWGKLKAAQEKQDWLEMLCIMDEDELDEYPKEAEIDKILEGFFEREFVVSYKARKAKGYPAVSCEGFKTVSHAGGKEGRWETDTSALLVEGRWNDNGEGQYKIKSQLLKGKIHFYGALPLHGSLSYYYMNVHILENGMQDLTPEYLEEYEQWLKEN